ncbi:hypothetical protein IFM89_027170, partial [Coptis chinensis]
ISGVLEQLHLILQTEVKLLAGVRKESEKLADTLTLIRGVLEDAEEKQVNNEAVKQMQDTDDIIEQMKGSGEMTCLRVSDLRYNFVREVPDETLKLNGCDSLWKLPEGIGKLHNLRHLELKRTDRLSYFPWGLERLRCLPTLSKVILDYDGGKGCQIGELNFLDRIQGEVRIQGLERVASSKHVKLKEKEKLRSLALSFSAEERQGEEESVLDGLQPHTNLAELEIQGYQGNKFPSWMMSTNTALPNLVTLSLVDCNQCSELPALGRLQYLETLYLSGLDSVKRIGYEFYGLGSTDSVVVFPKLHTFTIRSMKECEEWHLPFPRDVEIFPKLRKLTVAKFMSLQMLPPGLGKLKSLEQVSLYGVKFQGPELFRIITRNSDDGNVTLSAHESVFPVLKKLELFDMPDWVEQECEIRRDEEVEGFIMPGLCKLEISHCLKLKVVPHYLFSLALTSLKIWDCHN